MGFGDLSGGNIYSKEDYFFFIKNRKSSLFLSEANTIRNFPGGPQSIKLEGSATFTEDQRGAGVGVRYSLETTIDSSAYDQHERVQWAPASMPFEAGTTENAFTIYSISGRPWEMNPIDNDNELKPKFDAYGTITARRYTRNDPADPWVMTHEETPNLLWQFNLKFWGGGNVNSGGRGVDSPEKKFSALIAITAVNEEFTIGPKTFVQGEFFSAIPGPFDVDPSECSYPWDSQWSQMSQNFTDGVASWVAIAPTTRSASSTLVAKFIH